MSRRVIVGLVGGITAVCLVLITSLTFVEPYHVALTWNPVTGELGKRNAGWFAHAPWNFVSTIDTRPQRVCITSGARAALNCRLVQFEPSHYREFIAAQGFGFYWWSNRISINTGHREEYRGMKDLLRGYAFSAQQYPFIHVLEEYQESG